MFIYTLQQRTHRAISHLCETTSFGPFLALLAFLTSVTMSLPFTTIIVPATLAAPQRWRVIAAYGASGSALGATLLVTGFHHLGWARLHELFPAMLTNPLWSEVTMWTAQWGIAALFVIALSPLPETPALIFCAIADLSTLGVLSAVAAGKGAKYGLLAALIARFPDRFRPHPIRQPDH